MQEIKLWNIEKDKVFSVNKSKLDYENRLEKWLIEDISILSDKLVVIGTQVITDSSKKIDILALNNIGEVVIIELKKDKTYREVIAQTLDYATWVKDLSYVDLNTIFNKHSKNNKYNELGDLFSEKFDNEDNEADEVNFNSDHKMLIVGSEIDDSTSRIIEYLSNEPYSVNINAVNFNYFKNTNGDEFLAQSFINPEIDVGTESRSKKRKRAKSTVTILFERNKLKIGDKVYLRPALNQGKSKSDACAEIVNVKKKCLKLESSDELYSFSDLRKILTKSLQLKDVNPDYGFGVKNDWETEDKKSLDDLLKE